MGNFAENLNLGNRFRPPCIHSFSLFGKNKQIQEIFHTLYILKLQLITQYIIEKT